MAGRRRYKVGDHPRYDKSFDILSSKSVVFFPDSADFDSAWIATGMQTIAGIDRLLQIWRGATNMDGFYLKNNTKTPSLLKECESQLSELGEEWDNYCQQRVNAGRERPEEWPENLQERRLILQARFDITKTEIAGLERKREEFSKQQGKVEDGQVLKYGCIGSGRIRGGLLVEIDGQHVKPDKDKVLRIDDKRSPFNTMKAADYSQFVVKPYLQKQDQMRTEEREKAIAAQRNGETYDAKLSIRPPIPEWPSQVAK